MNSILEALRNLFHSGRSLIGISFLFTFLFIPSRATVPVSAQPTPPPPLYPAGQPQNYLYLPTAATGSVAPPRTQEILVSMGEVWRYLDNGQGAPEGWQSPEFDDSGWKEGQAQFGYGDGDEKTVVDFGPDPANKAAVTYFRHEFTVEDPSIFTQLHIQLLRDDGGVLYLNGQEVMRSNLPAGDLTANSLAEKVVESDPFAFQTIPASYLRTGKNVIAASIHQQLPSSSDLSFDLTITGSPLPVQEILVPLGGPWRYLDSGTEPAPSWTTTIYDDSSWKLGRGQFGYGDDDEATRVEFGPDPVSKHITTYFRHGFLVHSPADYIMLDLQMVVDDGAVVYLNGEEIYRYNLPEGKLTSQTLATDVVETDQLVGTRISGLKLKEGLNLLAVEVHQQLPFSSDLSFDLSLTAAPERYRIGVIGDFGMDNQDELNVSKLVEFWKPHGMLTTGDNRYAARSFDQVVGLYYCAFLANVDGGNHCSQGNRLTNRFFPSTGNHDYNDGGGIAQYLDYFAELPGAGVMTYGGSTSRLYYDFVLGPIHFFAIDSEGAKQSESLAKQQAWLEATMKNSTHPWQIVFFHHPPYSSGFHGNDAFMQWPFKDWGADAVLAGHDHNYERLEKDGIPFFVNGAGGAALRAFRLIAESGSQVRYRARHGAMLIEANACSLKFWFVDVDGKVVDEHPITPIC